MSSDGEQSPSNLLDKTDITDEGNHFLFACCVKRLAGRAQCAALEAVIFHIPTVDDYIETHVLWL